MSHADVRARLLLCGNLLAVDRGLSAAASARPSAPAPPDLEAGSRSLVGAALGADALPDLETLFDAPAGTMLGEEECRLLSRLLDRCLSVGKDESWKTLG